MNREPDEAMLAAQTLTAVHRFNEAFNRHDVDAVMALMTDDCVFDTTAPAPDGELFRGQEAVRGAWEAFFAASPRANFETEEIFACGDRCVCAGAMSGTPATRSTLMYVV